MHTILPQGRKDIGVLLHAMQYVTLADLRKIIQRCEGTNTFGDIYNQLDTLNLCALSDTCLWIAFDDYDDKFFEVGEKSHKHMTPNSQPKGNNQASSTEFHPCSGQFDARKYKKWVGENFLYVD
jgi:hypothetical protein